MGTKALMQRLEGWGRSLLLEIFVMANLAFLVIDVCVAHAVNYFTHWAEWIPVGFAVVGSGALLVALFRRLRADAKARRWVDEVVGWGGVLVGVAGMVWHLEGQFFQTVTMERLVYSAPFVAPLSFAGLGLLLLMNRRVPHERRAWGRWVVVLATCGFIGNFGLSLADHAQNGFFYVTEWIPVITSALAVGYFIVLVVRPAQPRFLRIGYIVLGLQVLVGLLGFVFHLLPLFEESTLPLVERIVFGPPVFAPLLFVDLSVLAALGLWDLQEKVEAEQPAVA